MKHLSKRGAARVSAVWLIVVIVLFLAALVYGYSMGEEASRAEQRATAAAIERDAAEQRTHEGTVKLQAITEKVGFNDRDTVGSTSNPDVAEEGLKTLAAAFPLDATATTYEATIPLLVTAYQRKLREIQDLQTQIADLESQRDQTQSALASVQTQKDGELADLRTQIGDVERSAQSEKDELEGRIATLTSARNQVENDLVAARDTIDSKDRERTQIEQEFETRENATRKVLGFLREPDKPDGEILAASPGIRRGWINLGAKDRINLGIRFTVINGSPTDDRVKGWAEVVDVEEEQSEVMFYDLTDPFDPIVQGDLVFNKLYDSSGQRNAVLIGRFSGTYNEKELRILMDQIGIQVQPKVDSETDYLVVGSELWHDAEGEPLEDPVQPSDLPEYREAEAIGVQMVTLRDVERYFRK